VTESGATLMRHRMLLGLAAAAAFALVHVSSLRADEESSSRVVPVPGRRNTPGLPKLPIRQGSPAAAAACVGGFAGAFPCQNVDLKALVSLGEMGCASGNSLTGWTDPLDGKEWALMGCNNGIAFVDISDPENPVFAGKLPAHDPNAHHHPGDDAGSGRVEAKHGVEGGESLWRDVRVYSNYAYVGSEAAGHGLQVFDLTQLRSVTSPPVVFEETNHYDGYGHSHTTAVNADTGFIYAAGSDTCNGGLHMVDVSDPANPVFAGCVSQDGYVHETECVSYAGPDADYAGHELCFNANEDTLTIVDVTDKSAPIQISRTGYAGSGYTHQAWLADGHRYLLLDDELDEVDQTHNSYTYIWDLADLDAPVLMGHYTGPTTAIDHNLYIKGPYAYESTYRAGLRILDITGIASATLFQAAYFDTFPADNAPAFNSNWNNYPFFASGNVILSDIEQGLFIVHPNLNPNPTALAIGDTQVTEGDSGTPVATFTVTLTNPVPSTVTVSYSTAFGSATPGVDYTTTSGTLTFGPSVTSQTFDVPILPDLLDENDETFLVNLTNASNASIADATGKATIVDDDEPPTMSIADASLTEGDSGLSTMTFTVSLSQASGRGLSASFATADGTAVAGPDYVATSGTLSFAAGVTSRTISVAVKGDGVIEGDETFAVALGSPSNVTLLDGDAAGTIVDDDGFVLAEVVPSSGPASGGTSITITGAGFLDGATVAVGGVAATDVVIVGPGTATATTPALPAGALHDVTVTNPGSAAATLPGGFFADYLDVAAAHPFHDQIVGITRQGIAAGCGAGNYCPSGPVTRAQMAVFLLKTEHNSLYTPPPCTGVFPDVACPGPFTDWVERLAAEGVTAGCGGGNYCPDAPVSRAQMAVFLLKLEHGPAYAPPACGGEFGDVACPSLFADWIEQLAAEGVTAGCGGGNFCPDAPNTRGQMAAFLSQYVTTALAR